MASQQKMRIILKAYDHQLIDFAAAKLVETVKKNGAKVSGPVPLPTKKEVVTILRAVHKYKDSQETDRCIVTISENSRCTFKTGIACWCGD